MASEYPYLWYLPDAEDETTEHIYRYCPGGLHPVHLDERYRSQYRILHKVGYGGYSHVWFAQNTASTNPSSGGVVLKFAASRCTGKTNEVEINKYLTSQSREELGFRNFLFCDDTFQVNGPNGVHDVIVTEPAILLSRVLQLPVELDEREVARQIFHGLSFLHKHGIVHRDLHLGNIAVEFPFLRTASVTDLMKASRHPLCHPCVLRAPIPHPPSLPAYLVEKADFCERLAPLMEQQVSSIVIKLLDFGCAFRPGTNDILSPEQGGPALSLKAPECLIAQLRCDPNTQFPVSPNTLAIAYYGSNEPMPEGSRPPIDPGWSTQSDVWTLGCSLISIFSRRRHHLFSPSRPGYLIPAIAGYLGPLPATFRALLEEAASDKRLWTSETQWTYRFEAEEASAALDPVTSWFEFKSLLGTVDENWAKLEEEMITARAPERAESVDEKSGRLDKDAKLIRDLFALVRQMLRWDPADRISAFDALDYELLKR
ncbi:kinase-like domain-containing protein [Mycena filopes]|nr:kinase-like domain-containing protein [Mycena filopes]